MKYAYWIVTGLVSLILLASAGFYVFENAQVSSEFVKLGFPTWVIYPLAFAKVAAVLVILFRKNRSLTEWAYAGLFFDILLAAIAHLTIADGGQWTAVVALFMLMTSYFLGKKVRSFE
ncbi:DoxX family protein [Nonlabens agnitus]|uniref:DoxX-like family protein n=1 Tax=Nonlabens agnitus TaxID=870484 RepID=A0A2S9WW54_9FLAO|nr:DoxX family protein [Nonlabens agnitus]PRP67712.1 hypothetical protein BST86_11715 [Nonlabens agnitus]